jgi:hypothetical protein
MALLGPRRCVRHVHFIQLVVSPCARLAQNRAMLGHMCNQMCNQMCKQAIRDLHICPFAPY